jgi:hypothetical protein
MGETFRFFPHSSAFLCQQSGVSRGVLQYAPTGVTESGVNKPRIPDGTGGI